MKEQIEAISNERLAICRECPKNSKGQGAEIKNTSTCLSCGCVLVAKTACLSCECPLHKWMPIINKTQEDKIKAKLNEQIDSPQP